MSQKYIDGIKSKYLGLASGKTEVIPFTDHVGPFVAYVEGNNLYAFNFKDSSTEKLENWSPNEWDFCIKDGYWKYFTSLQFEELVAKHKSNTKPMTQVIPLAPNRIKPTSIKKGSLYFNTTTQLVERVITIQDTSLIWSSNHKWEAKAYPKTAFRIATKDEVDDYLAGI